MNRIISSRIAVSIAALLLLAGCASTPPIEGTSGDSMEGSIATLEQLDINGTKQWVTIRGNDVNNPVLLFLSGGPGGSQLPSTRLHLSELERDFVVVNWDQPGAGKSYRAVKIRDLTPERFVEDGLSLIDHLRDRFNTDRIYLLGESWGTILGVWLCQEAPEKIAAYIGSGQMVNTTENDVMGYHFAIEYLRSTGDTDKADRLKVQGPPPYRTGNISLQYMKYINVLNEYMHRRESGAHVDILRDALRGDEYTLRDKINWIRGLMKVFNTVYPQLEDLDLATQADVLKVPVYMILGRHDVNAMTELAVDYFDTLEAPYKELIWFEHSGHPPLYSEADRVIELMQRVRDETRAISIVPTDRAGNR